MIPIREAIETGAWLTAEYSNGDNVISFRVRLTDFSKINLSAIDDNADLSSRPALDSNIWRLGLDVVNLCKKELDYWFVDERLAVIDQDGYEFPVFKNHHLQLYSSYAEQSGMKAFFGNTFPPKIKRSGAYPFELPDDADELFFGIRNGKLRET